MENYGLVVRFVLRAGAEDAFDQLAAEIVTQVRDKEPGTLLYATHRDLDDPRVRVFYELYADRAAFDAHEANDHTRDFLAQREQHVESFTVSFVTPQHVAGTLGRSQS